MGAETVIMVPTTSTPLTFTDHPQPASMSARVRPNRLGYVVAGITILTCAFYLVSSQRSLVPSFPHPTWDLAHGSDTGVGAQEKWDGADVNVPLIMEASQEKAEWEQQGLRITLAQLYENARLDLLGLDEELGEHEDESHEDYIYRLSMFVHDEFNETAAQDYLRKMLANLNVHITPPLLKSGIRRGIMQITDGPEQTLVEELKTGRRGGEHGLRRAERRRMRQVQEGWEENIWTRADLPKAHARLLKGSARLDGLFANLTRFDDRKIYIKYLALLLWGGAFSDDRETILDMPPLGSTAEDATPVLSPSLIAPRTSLQPLAPPPPVPPMFIPPSLDPNWTKMAQTGVEKEVALVLTRRGEGRSGRPLAILDSGTILAKAFHAVFLGTIARLSHHVDLEYARLKGEGKAFDSAVMDLDETVLLQDAVDRYLRVQYGSSLEEMDRVAGNEAVLIGDVLLLPAVQTHDE